MTQKIITALITFCLSTIIVCCNRPACTNTNTIFEKYAPDTKIYKDELVKQLVNVNKYKLTYWMNNYKEEGNTKYIDVHIQGDALCAKMLLTIKESEKGIEHLLKNKGVGYSGAELKNLKFYIKQETESTEFVFQEISGIID